MKNLIQIIKRKLAVIDITDYPYIRSYIDYRNQEDLYKNDTDQFSKDIAKVWMEQEPNNIPTIFVNISNIESPHTGLKLLSIT